MHRPAPGRRGATRRADWRERLRSPGAQLAVAAAFLAIAFLLGGGSRADIVSLAVLRPLAVLAIAYALYRRDPRWLAHLGLPFWLLAALLAWSVVQLIPLPHALWSALPGRGLIAANDAAIGLGEVARAISLVPSRTINTVFALLVPVAVMLTTANLDQPRLERLLWVVYVAIALNALVAALQMLGPPNGPFYFFRITNYNNPVGLFSNRNHLAIFFASAVPLLAHAAIAGRGKAARRPLVTVGSVAAILCLFLFVLVTGSRAGTILFGAALAASSLVGLVLDRGRPGAAARRRGKPVLFAAGAAAFVAVGLAILLSSRATTIDRFFDESLGEDLRVALLPQLWDMLQAYFPVGTGFGAFEFAYTIFEPSAILRTTYLNHAHNDVLEFLIEGGAVGAVLLAAFGLWFVRVGVAGVRTMADRARGVDSGGLVFGWLALAVLLAGSIGDYPLRAPALMAYAALLCCLLHRRAVGAARL